MDTLNTTHNVLPHTPHRVVVLWKKLNKTVIGRRLFNFLLAYTVPYSGSIKAKVITLGDGHVKIALKDRRAVRNHLNSIHAIALANLGELASGMAMFSVLSAETRAIVVNLDIQYLKKARGDLIAIGRANPPSQITEATNSLVYAEIKDSTGELVSKMTVDWLLSPPLADQKIESAKIKNNKGWTNK